MAKRYVNGGSHHKAPPPRVALIHDWLVGQRGGEQVLEQIAGLYPDAPIYTLVHVPGQVAAAIERHPIVTSSLSGWPLVPRHFRAYLPFFYAAVQRWDLTSYDLLLSTSHCVAHGVVTRPGQVHLAYIHTPARYLYDALPDYLPDGRVGRLVRPAARLAARALQHLDRAAARRPTHLLANSHFVAQRIRRHWQRTAPVLHPPVDVDYFAAPPDPAAPPRRGLLCVSALVPYKRVDLAIRLAQALHLPLTVVGDGPQRGALAALAGPQVRFCRGLSRAQLRDAYRGAAALVFCGTEDFGIAPVEAMAAGCPVLGLDRGGLQETVGHGATSGGVLVPQPSVAAFCAGYQALHRAAAAGRPSAAALRQRAARFSHAAFLRGYVEHLAACGVTPPVVDAAAFR